MIASCVRIASLRGVSELKHIEPYVRTVLGGFHATAVLVVLDKSQSTILQIPIGGIRDNNRYTNAPVFIDGLKIEAA